MQYRFPPVDEFHVPMVDDPVRACRRTLTIPQECADRQALLTREGVDSAFHIWVSGEPVRSSDGNRLPAGLNVTSCIRVGDRLLPIRVYGWPEATYREGQGQRRLIQVYCNVHLFASPTVHARDFRVGNAFDEEGHHAVVELKLNVRNNS